MPTLRDPISLETLDSSSAVFLSLTTSRGDVRLKVNQSTLEKIGREGLALQALSNADEYRDSMFWGSYYGNRSVGEVTGDFVREVLDTNDPSVTVDSLALNVFFDDESILSSSNNPLAHNDSDCDCNCNCNCNCDNDCNCDCNCG